MSSDLSHITSDQLKRAIRIKQKIETLTRRLDQLLASNGMVNSSTTPKQRRMSAAGRAAIAAAQKARWAKIKGNKPATNAKRKMSAAARARISAAAKLRWKAAKAAGKMSL